ncbi:MAG: hypothetical protein PGN09_10230 [Sphingomonas fennica]
MDEAMTCDETLDRIDAHQQVIRQLVSAARLHTDRPAADATADLLTLRTRMLTAMRAYQAFKHTAVFDPVIATAHPLRAVTARRLKASCVMASEAYRLHTTRWPADRIAAEWTDYAEAMDSVCLAIEKHLGEERVMVTMLLAGTEE